jgi:hypothetical protein
MSNKPEWFEMASGEQSPEVATPKSKKRIAKIALLTVPLLLVGGAMVFAEGDGEGDDAPKIDTTISSSTSANTVSDQSATTTNSTSSNSTSNGVASPSTTTQKGVGVQPPSAKGGDDDNEGFIGRGDHEGRERHHEGGEHEGGFGEDD